MLSSSPRLILAIVGACGAGKSTLASAFGYLPGVDVVKEVSPKAVETVDKYRELNVPAIQSDFLRMRLAQAMAARSGVVVFDRTVEEDRNVFLPLHHELGGLSDHDLARLDKLAKRTGKRIGTPAATIIVCAEPEVLRQRIANGARPSWLENSFDRQLELYAAFIRDIKGAVLELDTTRRSPLELRPVAAWIVETAWLAAARSRMCENQELALRWDWRSP